jgi:hypothetical protein
MSGSPRCLLVLAVSLALGCAKRTPPPPPAEAPPAPSVEEERPGAAAVASALASVRARISLAAPPWELQPLSFGRHLLARLGRASVEVYSLPDGATVFERPLEGARGVVEIAGGSVLAVGLEQTLRIDPGAKAPVRLPPVPWLPGTVLLPERRDSGLVWAVQTMGRTFVRQRLDLDPTRSFDKAIALDGYDGGSVTPLRDGALLYRSTDGVRRALPESRPHAFKTTFEPWRLLPARRVDQAWAIAADGRIELWQLGDRLLVQKSFTAGAAPFSAAASPDYLALVLVDEPGDAPRRFRLLVLDGEGKTVLERALPPGPPEVGEDWTEVAVRDRHVVLSDSEPFVAVGGPESLEVLRLPEGARVLGR